jgi:hypothetical protein
LDDEQLSDELERIYISQATTERPEGLKYAGAEMVGGQILPMTLTVGGGLATGGVGGAAVAAATYGTMGYGQNLMQGYMQAREQGKTPDEAVEVAKSFAKAGAATGAAEGIIGYLNPFMRSGTLANKTLLKGVKTALTDGGLDATVAMGMQVANNQYGQGLGLEIGNLDGVLEQGAGELAFSLGMNALFGTARLKPEIHKALVYGLAQSDIGSIKMAVDAAVKEGVVDAARAGKNMDEILNAKKAFDVMPDNLPEETKVEVVPQMERKNQLEKELEDKDGSFAPAIEAEMEEIDRDIREKIGSALTEKEQKEYDKLKAGGTEEKPLSTNEKAKLKHYERRVKQAEKIESDKDAAISKQQKRLNLPSIPEVLLSDEAESILVKAKVKKVVPTDQIGVLTDELYGAYKALVQTRNNPNRRYTKAQIDEKAAELEVLLETLETVKSLQEQSGGLVTIDFNKKYIKTPEEAIRLTKKLPDAAADTKDSEGEVVEQVTAPDTEPATKPTVTETVEPVVQTEEVISEPKINEDAESTEAISQEAERRDVLEDSNTMPTTETSAPTVEQQAEVVSEITPEGRQRILDARRWSKLEYNIKRGENLTTEEYSKLRATKLPPEITKEQSEQLKADNDKLLEGIKTTLGRTKKTKADKPKVQKSVIGFQQVSEAANRLGQNWLADKVRQAEDYVAKTLQRASVSENKAARYIQDFITSFSRGAIDTEKYATAKRQILKGTIGETKSEVEDFHKDMWEIIGDNIESADRIHQVLDPELRATELTYDDLTDSEKQLTDLLRQINEYTHNENYRLGKISKETYDKYKGKYIGREYDIERDYDFNLGKPLKETLGIYKQREEVDELKRLASIKDPIYLTLRRMMQTGQNKAVNEYAAWLNKEHGEGKREQLIFDEPREGTIFLGNGFGELSQKHVARHVAEDFKGFMFTNKLLELAYDANKAYDGFAPRQFMKELLTVGNPQVQLGNFTSNVVFSWLGGVDTPTFLSKLPEAISEINNKGDAYNFLVKEGLIGTDFVSSDLKPMETLLGSDKNRSTAAKIRGKARGLYSGADDAAKVQMYLALKDSGYSDAEAARNIFEALQNYQNTGRVWDFAAKTPIIGNSFVKFTPEMLRMIKNGMTRHPLHTVAMMSMLYAAPKLIGKYFGDEDEEIEAAGRQKGIPKIMIPFTDVSVPLAWRFGDKRVNVARYMMPLYVYDVGGESKKSVEMFNKFVPYQFKLTEQGGIEPSVQDPFMGPIVNLIRNKDFRDKPIVEETDNATDKMIKRLRFGARSYGGFFGTMADDIASTNMTGEDFYGRRKTATDVALNSVIKIETFDDERLKEGIQREFDGYEKAANHLYQAYAKKRKALTSDLEQAEKDKKLTKERRKELTARATEKLQKLANNVLEEVGEIEQQQIEASDFYRLLSRKTPYQSIAEYAKDNQRKIKQIEGRIDGKFKGTHTRTTR